MEIRYREKPRDPEQLKNLKSRLHRIQGQLNGIEKMLDENRYCGDVLIQVSAVEKALESLAYQLLENHLETCVRMSVKKEDPEIMKDVMELIKKIK